MRITSRLKLRPFSHRPGTSCLIPNTSWEVTAFPALLKFYNHDTKEEREEPLPVKGPVRGFTLLQDLERGRVEVFGRGEDGYFKKILNEKSYSFLKHEHEATPSIHLSLGVHKSQDWDKITQRSSMQEVLPFLLALSQQVPERSTPEGSGGVVSLVETLDDGLFFQAALEGILSPRLEDKHHLGIIEGEKLEGNPLGLFPLIKREILSLFFQENESWHLLPRLPKEFHAGRLIGIETKSGHLLDLEWSKKALKKAIIHPVSDGEIRLNLSKGLNSFRVRRSWREKGERQLADALLTLQKNKPVFLDRFMK